MEHGTDGRAQSQSAEGSSTSIPLFDSEQRYAVHIYCEGGEFKAETPKPS
jgi:hypothetical protein